VSGGDEARFEALFDASPVSMWVDDFTEIMSHLDALRESGVADLRSHLQGDPEALRTVGELMRIKRVNTATLALFEATDTEKLLSELHRTFVPETLACFVESLIALYEGAVYFESETVIGTLNGGQRHVLMALTVPYDPPDLSHTILTFTDITTLKLTEQRLAEKAEALERSNSDLGQFAHAASHDLQEPLHTVAGYCDLVLERCAGQLDEESTAWLRKASDGAGRMKQLVTGLLSYAEVGTAAARRGRLQLDRAVSLAMDNLDAAIRESGATITYDPLPEVYGHEQQLVQLFQNLLSNAIKYRGDAPPQIRVSARYESAAWLVSVADNGIGIDHQYAGQVFEIFTRLHARTDYSGTGIGLALCKRIVDEHGGRIWFDSTPGKGATFYFTLAN